MRILLFLASFSAAVLAGGTGTASLPADVRRVVFLGDSITYNGAYAAHIETYFVTRHPGRAVEFLNLGLSSETVSGLSEPDHGTKTVKFPRPDLHERLARVLAQTRPDLVFACYGMNDGIYLPFDEGRFAAFQTGLRRLREAVIASGARIIHLTPPVYDSHVPDQPGYEEVLARYSAWLLERRADNWQVIDLHVPMLAALRAGRETNPAFTFARDHIHPDEAGHWVMARAVLVGLGARELDRVATPADLVAGRSGGPRLAQLVRERANLLRDAWLTATGHTRPGVKAGPPLAEAQARAGELTREIQTLVRPAP